MMSKKPTPVTVAVPFKSRKLLDADGGLPQELISAERAEAIRAFLGESFAPGQTVAPSPLRAVIQNRCFSSRAVLLTESLR
jgi:hypothetical protein